MTIRINPYQRHSLGAKKLAKHMGVLLMTPQQIRKHGTFNHVINWGSTEARLPGATYLNDPGNIAVAVDKLAAYHALHDGGVPVPTFTEDREVAHQWWLDGETVVCRKLLRASQGRGMVLASRERQRPIVPAPLYTKYTKKADEYRVHCVRGDIIDIQMKRKRKETENERVNYQIRNYHNGWVFCRGGVVAPDCVRAAGIAAVDSLRLDFGGVDIGYNRHEETATVYEVNTAPGIEGSTLEYYYRAFVNILPELQSPAYQRRRGE